MSNDVRRLFKQFQPKKYLLDIIVDPEAMTFSGTVIVNGDQKGRPSQRLTFHQNKLTITKASITRHDKKGDQTIVFDRINNHNKFDEVRLHAKAMLYPGHYTISMAFKGKISRAMNGMYPCFFELKGQQKKLIATQFESHHAREVFPCIDEPEAKAVFELALTHPADAVALSNTPIANQRTVVNKRSATNNQQETGSKSKTSSKSSQVVTTFEPTPHMSTYLLAFVFGDMKYKEAKTKDGVIIRAYATPDNVSLTEFALETAVKCLEFYNDYFGIDYPLQKCDLIALPDFASGAMENWGCITFREQSLLVDPANTSLSNKQYVALVVAHELTHQWFGNLVTMRWWTDLWLNEGFASWMEYLAVDHIFPDWELWTQFVVDEQQQALKLDALEYTHPVEVPVHHPDEIRTIFDAISYSKGASVINMLNQYLGDEVFRDGLRHYLTVNAYGNTDTVDLWASLEEVSGKPVREFMHTWTVQSGFPLITADVESDQVTLRQSRFFTNPLHGKTTRTIWPVPLLAEHPTFVDTLHELKANIDLPDTQNFKLNRGQSGFYRVVYNATHLQHLGDSIQRGHMPPVDRLGILSDLFEAAKAGHADTVDALHFLTYFKLEDNYAVWDTIVSAIGNMRLIMDDEKLREAMKPYVRELIGPQLKRLGWDRNTSDSHFDRLLRPLILGLAASADEPSIVKKCLALFAKIEDVEQVASDLRVTPGSKNVKRGINIDPDLRGTVFGTVARLGGELEFDKLLKLHNASSLSEERVTIAAAMTGFEQPALIKRALDLITTDTVRLQDVSYWIAYSFLNRYGRTATWSWLKTNWEWLQTNLGSDLSFYRMPIYAARVFSDPAFIHEYQEFFKPKMSPALDRSYNQGLEMLQWQSAWKKRALKEVKNFFKPQSKLT